MGTISRRWWSVAAFAVLTTGGMLPGVAGWLQVQRPLEFFGLIVVVVLASASRSQRSAAEDWAVMPPAFVFDFIALLLFGANAAMLVAATLWVGTRRNQPQIAQDDIPVLENYDVLSNFEPLTELPPPVPADDGGQQQNPQL